MPNKTTAQARTEGQATLDYLDKWVHALLLMSYIALEAGADPAEVDAILKADKAEIDRLLVERMRQK